jgi:hypothetical protein
LWPIDALVNTQQPPPSYEQAMRAKANEEENGDRQLEATVLLLPPDYMDSVLQAARVGTSSNMIVEVNGQDGLLHEASVQTGNVGHDNPESASANAKPVCL